MKDILTKITKEFTYVDGGCGTILQEMGLKPGELPETWNVLKPRNIQSLHYDYLTHGANVLTLNTFGANILKFKDDNSELSLQKLIKGAVDNARYAICCVESGTDLDGNTAPSEYSGTEHYIALDIGPLGKLLKPLGDLSFNDAVSIFKKTIEYGAGLVDIILIETMNDIYEAKAAVLAAKETTDKPIILTCAFDGTGKLLTGADPKTVVAVAEGLGVSAVGVNCSLGPRELLGVVSEICEYASVPVVVSPNAGIPRSEHGKTVFDVLPDEFSDEMVKMAELGARVLGGCCGTTPMHILKTRKKTEGMTPVPLTDKEHTIITSYTHSVIFDKRPILIGERINPTGKSKFKQALRDHNIDYILQEGLTQQEKKADVLDVNVGLPEIDEPSMMEEVVFELQAVTDLPLQIDTTDVSAMERALRHYNGKAMINSVNGKESEMEKIFPLVKKYGGLCVALTIDEDGIPKTAEGRLKIVEKIYKRAADYGIKAKDIIIDPLCMSISAEPDSASVTLDSLRLIKERFNGKTSLGVSNISFGLPRRELVNASFFNMAMCNGLNAAIMNPSSVDMMTAYYTFCALNEIDANCGEYIDYASKLPKPGIEVAVKTEASGEAGDKPSLDPLTESITKGLKERAAALTGEYLKDRSSIEIIDGYLIPALDIVGKGFEQKTVFLPQLLMSAEAAKSAFDVIKDSLSKAGNDSETKGEIVIATVKGDIHDIGKNIVKVLLENYGYKVYDLGKDVPPEIIVQTVKDHNIKLVGLSALMTTTVPSMEETIKLLKKEGLDAKVCVGGAVLTQEYADMIGADKYARDAMETVRYAEEIFVK